jgi:Predicted Zn-dependent protease (DUF2268)
MLSRIALSLAGGVLLSVPSLQSGNAAPAAHATTRPVIHIEDVARFYRLYDATHGHPTAAELQDYIDHGSDGLKYFVRARNTTGERIAAAIDAHPALYSDARRCMALLPRVRVRVAAALHKLKELYPEAKLLPVTIVVGRGKPVAIGDSVEGVEVGLESMCMVNSMNPNVEDRFVHVIAHEYGHVQQFLAFDNDEHPTVLAGSLMEGAAEFIAEMTSGDISYSFFKQTTRGHEKEIETAFVADEDSQDLSRWLYNGTLEKPGDLGYWVGYRICKAYYQHAADKRAAFRDIVEISDPKLFLAKSGWYPGIKLQ